VLVGQGQKQPFILCFSSSIEMCAVERAASVRRRGTEPDAGHFDWRTTP
jgi:hypothetical protein